MLKQQFDPSPGTVGIYYNVCKTDSLRPLQQYAQSKCKIGLLAAVLVYGSKIIIVNDKVFIIGYIIQQQAGSCIFVISLLLWNTYVARIYRKPRISEKLQRFCKVDVVILHGTGCKFRFCGIKSGNYIIIKHFRRLLIYFGWLDITLLHCRSKLLYDFCNIVFLPLYYSVNVMLRIGGNTSWRFGKILNIENRTFRAKLAHTYHGIGDYIAAPRPFTYFRNRLVIDIYVKNALILLRGTFYCK